MALRRVVDEDDEDDEDEDVDDIVIVVDCGGSNSLNRSCTAPISIVASRGDTTALRGCAARKLTFVLVDVDVGVGRRM